MWYMNKQTNYLCIKIDSKILFEVIEDLFRANGVFCFVEVSTILSHDLLSLIQFYHSLIQGCIRSSRQSTIRLFERSRNALWNCSTSINRQHRFQTLLLDIIRGRFILNLLLLLCWKRNYKNNWNNGDNQDDDDVRRLQSVELSMLMWIRKALHCLRQTLRAPAYLSRMFLSSEFQPLKHSSAVYVCMLIG